jgi:uncharacterized protein YecE (DUF72 family)
MQPARTHDACGDLDPKLPMWFIGLVGFSYPEWSRTLYANDPAPHAVRGGHRLTAYATHFNAVEINTTFYGIPAIDTVRKWEGATPGGFRFCVKMSRDVTHGPTPAGSLASADPPPGHLLRESTFDTARRFLDAVRPLGGKLGAVLLQFPPKFAADRRDELTALLDRFDRATPLAVELRHDSWWNLETAAILHDRGICWAGTDESPRDEAERAPVAADTASPHGPT